MMLLGETIFDDLAYLTDYQLQEFIEKVNQYAQFAMGITRETKHPFWDDLKNWLTDNSELFNEEYESSGY